MGILDLLNPKKIEADKEARGVLVEQAKTDPAAAMAGATIATPAPVPPAPAVIPLGTPAPAVSPVEIEADRAARLEAAKFAAVDPEAAMAGAEVYPPPPTPKLIPIGTPSPVPTLDEIAADKARRLEIAKEFGRGEGAPLTAAPIAQPAVPGGQAAKVEAVPPITQEVQAAQLPPEDQKALTTAAAAVDQAQAKGQPTEKAEATFAEKLKAIAKKTGQGVLDILQAAAYGYAGVDKQTRLEKQIESDAQEKKDLLDNQWQLQMQKISQDFQSRQAEMDRDFSMTVAKAKNDWDVQAAKEAYEQEAEQNKLDRQNAMSVATANHQQQSAVTLDQLKQMLASAYGGQ
jgi:hypothetical protein